jgi:hypothetical protein
VVIFQVLIYYQYLNPTTNIFLKFDNIFLAVIGISIAVFSIDTTFHTISDDITKRIDRYKKELSGIDDTTKRKITDTLDARIISINTLTLQYYSVLKIYLVSLILAIVGLFISTCNVQINQYQYLIFNFLIVFLGVHVVHNVIRGSFTILKFLVQPNKIDETIQKIETARKIFDEKDIDKIIEQIA